MGSFIMRVPKTGLRKKALNSKKEQPAGLLPEKQPKPKKPTEADLEKLTPEELMHYALENAYRRILLREALEGSAQTVSIRNADDPGMFTEMDNFKAFEGQPPGTFVDVMKPDDAFYKRRDRAIKMYWEAQQKNIE